MRSINHKSGIKFDVDLNEDFYSEEFWNSFENEEYEPDTCDYLRRKLTPGSLFIDVGAANGSFTLLAASLGAEVVAFEPLPIMFRVLSRNVQLNSPIRDRISVINAAVAVENKTIELNPKKSKGILTNIVFSNVHEFDSAVQAYSLAEFLDRFSVKQFKTIVMKIDVEGAEYSLLKSRRVLQSMQDLNLILLVAFHPGFTRASTIGKLNSTPILKWIPRTVNFFENLSLYKSLSKYGKISRINGSKIDSRLKFSLLISAGMYEFEINFHRGA